MAGSHKIIFNGKRFTGRTGEVLLDAALRNGVELPHDCRAGHCGSCRMRLLSGAVEGGEGTEEGVIHACQSRITGDVEIEPNGGVSRRTVAGALSVVQSVSPTVMEVHIRTERALPYHAGQYVQLKFDGFPSRPFSITHPVVGDPAPQSVCFHIRRMNEGQVTKALGRGINIGHRVEVTGPFGEAYFRPNMDSRLLLIATNTGFGPIWSIAVAALREDPERPIMVVTGGRDLGALYMGPALARLAQFKNVVVTAACSTPQPQISWVKHGRPTNFLPSLFPTDLVYVCGAPPLVESVQSYAAQYGAVCHADPFMASDDGKASGKHRALPAPANPLLLGQSSAPAYVNPTQPTYVDPAQNAYALPTQLAYVDPRLHTSVNPTQPAYVGPAHNAYTPPAQPAYVDPMQNIEVPPAQLAYAGTAQNAEVPPAQLAYAGSAQNAYVDPALNAYVSSTQPAYADPTLNAHVNPTQPAYVDPTLNAYVNSTQPAFADPALNAYVNATQPAYVDPAQNAYVNPSSPDLGRVVSTSPTDLTAAMSGGQNWQPAPQPILPSNERERMEPSRASGQFEAGSYYRA